MDKTLLTGLCSSLNKLGGMIPALPCPELLRSQLRVAATSVVSSDGLYLNALKERR